MSDTDPKVEQLLQRLLGATREEKIEWEIAGDRPTSFRYRGPEGDTVLIDSRDDDDDGPYDLYVFGEGGVAVLEVKWSSPAPRPSTNTDMQLQSLYSSAKNRALGASDVIDRLLRDIPEPDLPF
jgi:hypothetical protein